MNKKFIRQFTIAQSVPLYPSKLSSSQIQLKLAEDGMFVSLRTIQRDLVEMSHVDYFGVLCDLRSKPHGWTKLNVKALNLGSSMPLSLAVAIQIWSTVASNLLPSNIESDLKPLIKYASVVLSKNPTMYKKANEMIMLARQRTLPNSGGDRVLADELCRVA